MRLAFGIAVFMLSLPAFAAADFDLKLKRGPHAVGMKVLQQYDYSRVYKPRNDLFTGAATKGERARPVQTIIWYPAQRGGTPVTHADYLRTSLTEETYNLAPAEIEQRWSAFLAQHPGAKKGMDAKMWAVRDARPEAGKFPVVVYAPSFNASAHENADLCEYLASHGYVVLSSPDMGARGRSMTEDIEGIEAQAADISFLISSAHALPQADTARIAVVGFSWGGISNVFAAAKDDRIRALVSLDGSIRYYPEFVDGGAKAASYVTPARVAVPYLFIAAQPKSMEVLNNEKTSTGYSFINNMKYADVYLASMLPMHHADFSADGLRRSSGDPDAAYSRDEVLVAHSWAMRYVQQFLNAYLKDDAQALAFLQKPATGNGSPHHMMTIEQRHGKETPPGFDNLALELNTKGYAQAQAAYQRMRQLDPGFHPGESQLNMWGYGLQRSGRAGDAVEVMKLAVSIYPDSWNLYDSLAEMYEAAGDKALAVKNYRRSLELNAGNQNAVEHLKVLEPQS
ncbi:dienelactone hydrolase [Pseudoduganella sp. FT26W]|uniref:Dienelactone hydrolase n=1 Tax=Duganella aquatilis TaxID=2666082 RepID=A0A844CV05_9BURK|nr:CocE/NonD family hydrolase [Duganella aquatilis]MRW84607.1 dienelactone hydrolase [Duganella aquatilis]